MTRLYRLSNNDLVPIPVGRLAREDMIQNWIEKQPQLLGLDLLIVGREVETAYGGRIDLLGMNAEGGLVIMELKRDRTPEK